MRYIIMVLVLLCGLALPSFAAESLEATQNRVRELEKANVSLRSDLARTLLTLDAVNANLTKTSAALTEQIALTNALKSELDKEREARKALETKLAQLLTASDARLAELLAAEEAARKAGDKELADADVVQQQALAALNAQFTREAASLKNALDQERQDRLAAEAKAAEADAALAKQNKKNRTLTFIMSGLLAGAIAATN